MAGAIFGGNINAICTALMMVAMLVFAVAWEAFTGYLDRRVRLPAFVSVRRRKPPDHERAPFGCSSRKTWRTKKC
eukprot:COSAG06_NODE_5199_length_3643_cov_6.610892_2_plen_75_part_00